MGIAKGKCFESQFFDQWQFITFFLNTYLQEKYAVVAIPILSLF